MTGFDSDDVPEEAEKQSRIILRMSPSFSGRIDGHLLALRKMKKQRTKKQEWIAEAIIEKLQQDEDDLAQEESEKRLNLPVSPSLAQMVDSRIEILRRMGINRSKNRWVIDAIAEKLDRESKQTWRWMDDQLSQSSSDEK